MPADATPGTAGQAAARWQSAAVTAGRAILLSLGFAGLGAAMAPADWPDTMSVYSLHMMSPSMGYASWGVAIALGLETLVHTARSMQCRCSGWTPAPFAFCLLLAQLAAVVGTLPYCICDDLSNVVLPTRMITFDDAPPEPSGP